LQRCQGQKGNNVWLHLKQHILLIYEGNRRVLMLFLEGKCVKTAEPGALRIVAEELTLLLTGIDLEKTQTRPWWRKAA
jgi:hypothetical protein